MFTVSRYRRHLSIPKSGGSYDACSMYAVNFTALIASGVTDPDPSWPISECQKGWEYDFTDVPYTSIATEVMRKIAEVMTKIVDVMTISHR